MVEGFRTEEKSALLSYEKTEANLQTTNNDEC